MTFEDDLAKLLTEKIRVIRYGNLIIKALNPNSDSPGIMVKNQDNPYLHFHLYSKNGKPKFHYTLEDVKLESKKHRPIDIQEFQGDLAKWFQEAFKDSEKLEVNDPKFLGRQVRFLSKVNLKVKAVNNKEILIGDDYETTLKKFENINEIQEDAMGFLLDENGNEKEVLFLKSGDVYKLDLSSIEQKKFPEGVQN